jgi:hypothetical protein
MSTILTGIISSKKEHTVIITKILTNGRDKRLIKDSKTGKYKQRERVKTE